MRTLVDRLEVIAQSDKKVKFFNQCGGAWGVWVEGVNFGTADIETVSQIVCREIEAVRGFFKENYFLSNYGPGGFVIDGVTYKWNEQWYMVNKTFVDTERAGIMAAESPNDCKQLGKKVTLRDDWEHVKDDVMLEDLRAKFSQNENLMLKLLFTGEGYLEETNTWGDVYWGVCNGKGKNMLGTLLMQVRDELLTELDKSLDRR